MYGIVLMKRALNEGVFFSEYFHSLYGCPNEPQPEVFSDFKLERTITSVRENLLSISIRLFALSSLSLSLSSFPSFSSDSSLNSWNRFPRTTWLCNSRVTEMGKFQKIPIFNITKLSVNNSTMRPRKYILFISFVLFVIFYEQGAVV